jgi:hypothetical protein
MKLKKIAPLLACSVIGFSGNAVASDDGRLSVGVEGGYAFVDIGAPNTAQTLANLSGSTVTYTYDKADLYSRIFMGYDITEQMTAEVGYFASADLNATYRISGASVTEAYSARGLDFSIIYKPVETGFFGRIGMHSSEISGAASLTIGGTTYAAQASKSGTGYLLGGGYEAAMGGGLAWRASFTYLDSLGGLSGADASLYSISILKRF